MFQSYYCKMRLKTKNNEKSDVVVVDYKMLQIKLFQFGEKASYI